MKQIDSGWKLVSFYSKKNREILKLRHNCLYNCAEKFEVIELIT